MWDLKTGQVMAQVGRSITLHAEMGTVVSPGCETIITRVMTEGTNGQNQHKWIVLDRLSGRQRFPSIRLNTSVSPVISPDGRYAVLNSGWVTQGTNEFYAIIDLSTGKERSRIPVPGFQTKTQDEEFGELDLSSVLFTLDSQELMTFECDKQGRWIVFHSVPDGVEVARCPVPAFPQYERLSFSHWASGKLLFQTQTSGFPVYRSIYRAFECVGHQLVRSELQDGFAAQFTPQHGESTWTWRGDGWMAHGDFRYSESEQRVAQLWNRTIGRIHPAMTIDRDTVQRGQVKYARPSSESPAGVPVEIQGFDGTNFLFRYSPDGRWLIDGGDRLRVYRTPPADRYTRIPGLLLLLVLGWNIDRRISSRQSPRLLETGLNGDN
jgi:hypothetical protein